MAPSNGNDMVTREAHAQEAALRAQKEDARLALEWFAGPAYTRIQDQYQQIYERYHQLLHHPYTDKDVRERAATACRVAEEFLGVKTLFERQLKHAESKLAELAHQSADEPKVWERILTFMR